MPSYTEVTRRPLPASFDPARCSQSVWTYGPGWTRQEQCKRPGRLAEEGALWCAQHAPSQVRVRRAGSLEQRKLRFERIGKPKQHAVVMLRLIRAIASGATTDPVALCAAFLDKYEK